MKIFKHLTIIVSCYFLFCFLALTADKKNDTQSEIHEKNKHIMLKIPGGTYIMGRKTEPSPDNKKRWIDNKEHEITVSGFYMDKTEVSNAQYHNFCKETGHRLPEYWNIDKYRCSMKYPDHPVHGISYADAKKYAEWAGLRLPTEAEWEYAARGGLVGKKYDNGDKFPERDKKNPGTMKVSSGKANGFGLLWMTGNVSEWVSDYYSKDYYLDSPVKDPKGPEIGKHKVVRGGGWHTGPGCSMVYYRNSLKSNWLDVNVGFRCVKDIN